MADALKRAGAAFALALAASTAGAQASAAASAARIETPSAVPTADDPALEARMLAIAGELRCLVCQNQTIADSHAGLADDLRRELREMVGRGDSDEQIVKYMTDRYGDFVLYRPPLKPTTALLWFGPAALLVGGLTTLLIVLKRRSRMSDDQFEDDGIESAEEQGART